MWIKIAPWAGCALLGWLLLNAHQRIGEEIEGCNADKLAAVADAEKTTRQTLEAAHDRRLAELARQRDAERDARIAAEAQRQAAREGVEARDVRIRQLELDVFNAEQIPDSRECLNVFAPAAVVERMFWDADCREAGAGGSTGAGADCTDTGGISDVSRPDFALITFGDVARGWNHDRQSLRECGANLTGIGMINETLTE